MGVCYTILLADEFNWGYVNIDKEKKLKEFKEGWPGYCCDQIAEWYGFAVFDIDKNYPLSEERIKYINGFCDNWYYIDDLHLTSIKTPEGAI